MVNNIVSLYWVVANGDSDDKLCGSICIVGIGSLGLDLARNHFSEYKRVVGSVFYVIMEFGAGCTFQH